MIDLSDGVPLLDEPAARAAAQSLRWRLIAAMLPGRKVRK